MIVEDQTRMMSVMLLCGAGLGAAYDFLHAVQFVFLKGNAVQAVLDIFFCILCAFVMIAAGLFLREDPFRLYVFTAVSAGFAVYMVTLGRIVRFCINPIYRIVKKSFILDKGETQKGENNATDMGDLRNLRKR